MAIDPDGRAQGDEQDVHIEPADLLILAVAVYRWWKRPPISPRNVVFAKISRGQSAVCGDGDSPAQSF